MNWQKVINNDDRGIQTSKQNCESTFIYSQIFYDKMRKNYQKNLPFFAEFYIFKHFMNIYFSR